MSFEIKQLTVNSTDKIHKLQGKIYIPSCKPIGIFQIVHGMTEHIERYDGIMSAAAERGYIAFGYDHLGHGRTALNDSELGFIAHKDGWKYLVNDVKAAADTVKKLFPNIPLYLMGHSMGSFIVRLAAEYYSDTFEKLIICGTSGKNSLAFAGLFLTTVLKKTKGEKYISNLVLKIAFGSYNKRFENISKYDWLTKDSEIIKKYSKDKFCTFRFTVSAMYDLITLCDQCNKQQWFISISGTMPILLVSGQDDPVGNYGKGVVQVYNKLLAKNANVKLRLYENCRHEILNDSCKDQVLSDIFAFLA